MGKKTKTAPRGLILARCDNWGALYRDGKLLGQGHSFYLNELGMLLVKEFRIDIITKDVDPNWAADVGHLPDHIEGVVWAGESA